MRAWASRPASRTGRWREAARRTLREFKEDNLPDWAAALTYYSVLSLFPGILVVVSLVGLGGESLSQSVINVPR